MKIGELVQAAKVVGGRSEGGPAAAAAGARAAEPGLLLEPGSLLKGRVLGMTSEGRLLLELAGQRVEARSSVPLTPGRDFWFEVRQGGSEPWLVPADKKGSMYRFLQQAAGGGRDFSRLAAGQPSLALAAEPAPEKIIRLLALLRSGEMGGGRTGTILEAMAAMNEQPPAPNQALFWLLPCFFSLDAGAGSWLFSLEQEGAEGEEAASLVFFLDMSRLGELQLRVRMRGERLEGDFFLADPAAADFLRGRLGELRERLAALGYRSEFRCRGAATALLPALKEALEKAAGGAPCRLIDTTA